MNLYMVVLILTGIHSIFTQIPHDNIYLIGCSETEAEVMLQVDGEEVIYADFIRRQEVWSIPEFIGPIPSSSIPNFFNNAVKSWRVCRHILGFWKAAEKNPPEVQDAPDNILYPRDDVELGVENTLICFVNHFYPPFINVTWTKNTVKVTKGVSLSRYHPNKDGRFHQFATLNFTPQEGDIYTCSVDHTALDEPRTRFWGPEMRVFSAGPAVLCGVGLILGLLGLATGTFLIVKANQPN